MVYRIVQLDFQYRKDESLVQTLKQKQQNTVGAGRPSINPLPGTSLCNLCPPKNEDHKASVCTRPEKTHFLVSTL